ncbi:MAG TPA: ABC transporter permease [Acidobacteriaceae bacterium]
MKLLAKLRCYTRSLAHRSAVESDIEVELRSHIDLRAADLERTGLTPTEAHRRACIEFGTVETHKQNIRTSLGLRLLDELRADLRFAARMLRRSPGFTAVAVTSLALGIGANTIIFTIAKGVIFDRLAVHNPSELRLLSVRIKDFEHSPIENMWGGFYPTSDGHMTSPSSSYPVYQIMRDQNRVAKRPVLEDIFAFKELDRSSTASIDGHASLVSAELVSGNFFQQLGVQPALGREIQPSDDATPGSGAVAVISDGLWSRFFGRSTSIIGKTIEFNLIPITIVGVAPPGFTGASSVQMAPDVFLPLSMQPVVSPWRTSSPGAASLLGDKTMWWVQVMARTRSGISDETASAALRVSFAQAMRATVPIGKDQLMPDLVLEPGSRGLDIASRTFSKPIYILGALTGFVLLLACVNLANLLLARSSTRQREMSVRLALGATRGRVLRQVLTESLLLASLGGTAGLFLGYFGRNIIPHLLSTSWEATPLNTRFDLRIFAFTMAISLGTGILFGIVPAWQSTRTNVSTALKDSAAATTRRRKGLLGKGLVVFQIALSSLLVVSAGLFAFTLSNLSSSQLGFKPDHLLMFEIAAPASRYPAPQDVALHQRIEDRLQHVPGVQSITLTGQPILADSMSKSGFQPVGGTPNANPGGVWNNDVGRSFFQTYNIPILYGRTFASNDTAKSPRVAVINVALAKQSYPNTNPVGKTFTMGDHNDIQIIGVSANAKYSNLRDDPPPTFYLLYRQAKENSQMTYVVRTTLSPAAILPSLRSAVAEVDKDLPLRDVRTQIEQINATIMQERLFATLTSAFGVLALILAAIGIYGIMAYTVARRTSEIGVRMALGAHPRQVRLMVLRESGWMAIIGIAVGIGASIGLARLVRAMLYGLSPSDPATLIGTSCLLFFVALIAAYGPARRASRIDPMQALRRE